MKLMLNVKLFFNLEAFILMEASCLVFYSEKYREFITDSTAFFNKKILILPSAVLHYQAINFPTKDQIKLLTFLNNEYNLH